MLDQSQLSPSMLAIIKKAYSVFKAYSPPQHFDLCMPCCVSIEEEYALRTTHLPNIPRTLIYRFNTSPSSTQTNKSEVAYLLPRVLELIALHEAVHHSEELYLACVSRVDHELWLPNEKRVLEEFALLYLKERFKEARQKQQILYLDRILIMFGSTGMNVLPLLDYTAQTDDFYVISSIAYLIMSNGIKSHYIDNTFKDKFPTINTLFEHWLHNNKSQLQQKANQAILAPQPIASLQDNYLVAQGLCALSDATL